jgi:pimeloyl-ACP methyl ester carboxylesterase
MPRVTTNGVELYYEREGQGEPLLLVHGLLFSGESWRPQIEAFKKDFEVVTVDLRGQHRSQTTDDPTEYDLWNQAEDVYGLIQALGIAPVHYAGLSMGGMIGMRLALRHPEVLRELILVDTSSLPEEAENVERYEAFRQIVESGELEAVLPMLPVSFFCDEFIRDRDDYVQAWFGLLLQGNPLGFARASRAVDQRQDITGQLGGISVPTLVIHGTEDISIPVEKARATADAIPDAGFALVEGGGHQSNIDHPEEVTRLMREFLAGVRAGAPAASGR